MARPEEAAVGDRGVGGIRPYEPGDAAALFEAAIESRRELAPWMPWCHPAYAVEDAESWVATQVERWRTRAEFQFVVVSPSGRFLGGCGIHSIDAVHRFAGVGYWVRSSATGAGVATAAVLRVRRWALANTDLERLEIVVAVGNRASARVAEKAGGVYEGVLRARLFLHGTAHDAAMYSLVRMHRDDAGPPVAGIDHVQLAMPAGGEDDARGFYHGLLGIPEVAKPPELAQRGGVWFEHGAVRVHLGVEPGFRPARKAHPALLVHDLDAVRGRLRAAGIAVVGVPPVDGSARAYVDDPFGNRIELVQRRA